ncbi:putative glutathione peroxidase [Helianthus annuus]|nr:putative glutathione peroxidase [Helianthus annuus]KAJ0878221.1 putative glutathione peroxidase [Helianthus annuus]
MISQSRFSPSSSSSSSNDSTGKDVNLSIYKGKVLLIVNVASKCGLTNSNYTQLTEIYRKYKDRGIHI